MFSILNGCAVSSRAPLDPAIKEDMAWNELSFDERLKTYQLLSRKIHYGVGTIRMDESSSESQAEIIPEISPMEWIRELK